MQIARDQETTSSSAAPVKVASKISATVRFHDIPIRPGSRILPLHLLREPGPATARYSVGHQESR